MKRFDPRQKLIPSASAPASTSGDGLVGAGDTADFHGDASGILREKEAHRHEQ